MSGGPLAPRVLEALVESLDRERFERALVGIVPAKDKTASSAGEKVGATGAVRGDAASGPTPAAAQVLSKILLADVLDETILAARPGDPSFPLRMLLGELGEAIDDDVAFALASGLSFYFRVEMDDEATMRLGIEVSRLYYRFAAERPLEKDLVREASPLLARLMSAQVQRLRFESVDAAGVFDSGLHERVQTSDATRAAIRAPKSFLCRVVSNGMVRAKALVQT
ncbi:MAG: hypothetical protein IT379_04885 [Deltaproteobacteria bacterium]|nr:hypothetical protein [Deltaproteobacteria bacterium]